MYDKNREFLKASSWSKVSAIKSDQELGETEPLLFKNYDKAKLIKLKNFEDLNIKEKTWNKPLKKKLKRKKEKKKKKKKKKKRRKNKQKKNQKKKGSNKHLISKKFAFYKEKK